MNFKHTLLGITLALLLGCISKNRSAKQASADTTKLYPAFSKDTLEDVYNKTCSFLWEKYVPISGQAETVQGELIRIIERLENEIAGNAKANWDSEFVMMAHYLRDTLLASGIFTKEIENEIFKDIQVLSRLPDEVATEKYYYDRLRRRIVEWYWRNKTSVKHTFNPELHR